jgi:diguanylate cyclase (GGDEF)-like protein
LEDGGTASGRILVAEDDRFYRQILGKRLRGAGYEVVLTANGEEAWQALHDQPVELLLTDWMMPRLDGYELCRRVKNDPGFDKVYCILLTAKDRVDDKVSALDGGADDYLLKPCDDSELLARVRTGLRVHRLYAKLEEVSVTDSLTEVGNRRFFDRRLREEVSRCRRYGTPLSLVLIDLDRFKEINDRHGHPVGDDVLVHVGAALRERVRTGELVARIGGDEFAVLMPNTDLDGARAFAEWVEDALTKLPLGMAELIGLEIAGSAGCAELPEDGSPHDLLKAADAALYDRKRERNDVRH